MIDEKPIALRFDAVRPSLDERARRLHVAAEAHSAGHGGVAATARATGVARSTIGRGLKDLRDATPVHGRMRRQADCQGSDAADGPGEAAGAGDDGRSDAVVALGLE